MNNFTYYTKVAQMSVVYFVDPFDIPDSDESGEMHYNPNRMVGQLPSR